MAPALSSTAFTWQQLPPDTYVTIQRALMRYGQKTGGEGFCDRDLPLPLASGWDAWIPFTVCVTPTTQALVVYRATRRVTDGDGDKAAPSHRHGLGLTCDSIAIAQFLADLMTQLPDESPLGNQCLTLVQRLKDRQSQGDGIGLLLTLLPFLQDPQKQQTHPNHASNSPAWHVLEAGFLVSDTQVPLGQQQQQDLLLHQVITQIRQNLDLSTILSTTVAEVRRCLKIDRLLIYRFNFAPRSAAVLQGTVANRFETPETPPRIIDGTVIDESCSTASIASLLALPEPYGTDAIAVHWSDYGSGKPIAIADVAQTYGDDPDLTAYLHRVQIKAQILAPIMIRDQLWGLLIAHQCDRPRAWTAPECLFLQNIAEHLGVAIQQTELYQQIRDQAQSLEHCVVAQTQDLRDAMVAAQSASRTKSEFLATMSHELRTPLTCIIGMSATLLRWSFGELSPRQRDYLTTIHTSGERLLALINDILDLSKIEAGRTVLAVAPLSLSTLARHCWESFRPEARDRDIEITYDPIPSASQDTFVGDARRIRQILANLLSNALKFTDAGGQVNLRVRREHQTAVFQIEDTGIGIPEAQQSLLFETFHQLEAGPQRRYQGTGLGLALTKQLVELHGGNITVNSQVGVGSVFTVRLPSQRLDKEPRPMGLGAAAEGQEQPRGASTPTEHPPEPVVGRIVLVEDQEETAGIICDLLTAADYQVIWVIEGSQVVEQVALLKPAAIIINLQLTGVDGQHMIQDLRESLVTGQIKILGLTSDLDNPSPVPGADAILTKPLDPQRLLEQVNALMVPVSTP
ncbi:ATP-binding protein [Leptolyngbya sp. PCC 6406]|uniref:hybrid sensor histidine kinase/response regulator n=1 Tax=Leptolyngbya sp. PCC 6406 TaxID=1173264 RepID=UPI0002AC8BE1|nr:ATP-binding protein [Leptolyngbya sp. PCC 6406]